MKNSKEKNLNNQKVLIFLVGTLAIVIIILSYLLIFRNSDEISDFERKAIYSYLENSISVHELYSLAGDSNFNSLQYAQSQIKESLDNYTSTHNTDTVPISEINIPNADVDFHGILVSDYEFIPEQNVFKRSIGANSNMKLLESSYSSLNNESVAVTDMKKASNSSYSISFNLVDSSNKEIALKSGNATIEINEDNSFTLKSCSFND